MQIFYLHKIGRKLHKEHSFWKEKQKSMSHNGTITIEQKTRFDCCFYANDLTTTFFPADHHRSAEMIVSHDHGGNPSLITRGQHHHPHQQHLMGPGGGGGGTPSSFRTLPSRQHHQQVSTLAQFFLLCFYQPRSGMVMGWVGMFLFWGRLAFF